MKDAFLRALNKLITNRSDMLKEVEQATLTAISDSCEEDITKLEEAIAQTQEDIVYLLMKKNDGSIDEHEYERQMQKLKNQADKLYLKKDMILDEQNKVQLVKHRTDAITNLINTGKILDEFDKILFKNLVRSIKVIDKNYWRLNLRGVKIKENIR